MAPNKSKPKTRSAEPVNVEVLATHYQKTFEVAYDYWKERNKLFIYLVLMAGIGLMLLLRVPTADDLIVNAIATLLNITEQVDKTALKTAFPFDILLSAILVVMFYLMQRLYSTNLSVMRTFMYVGQLEKEMRGYMGLLADKVYFTRESGFYWGRRSKIQTMSKWFYVGVLFIILVPFMVFKMLDDFTKPEWLVITVDLAVSVVTVWYWAEYARSSFEFDKPSPPEPESGRSKPAARKRES
jgi:hypothetical protein